ncbi:MAG TPA: hypothetical protein VMU84_04135 [Thermoanaerobaculia bacterium]|nr:hypothetical protein [Thermoanaerobaculia bacterium]
MLKLARVLFAISLTTAIAHADGILISWSPSTLDGVTRATFEAAKTRPTHEILAGNKRVTSWPEAYLLLVAANEHRFDKDFLLTLTAQLTDTTESKLASASRLIIWERITSGDLVFEGKGMQVADDLFTVAGRANWILRNVAEKNFGYVKPLPRADDLVALQKKWRKWISGDEQMADAIDPYATDVKGLEEIRSKEALQALIVSLRPSETKDALTHDCLQRLYQRDELPSDPADPAKLCSPDTYAQTYLAKLTNVQEPHDAKWWSEWWTAHERELVWDQKSATFRAP